MRARRASLDTLAAVHERDAYANLVLPGMLRARGITGPDAARATDLTYGTLRGLGTYDRIIDACASRPLPQIDARVLAALRLGTHQLLAGRVPPHAAVSTTVDLVRHDSGAGAARFANAVLRAVAERDIDGWVDVLVGAKGQAGTDERERLALRHLHPRWIVDALADSLGSEQSRLEHVLAADNVAPTVTLVALPDRSSVAELVEAGAAPCRWASTAATAPPGDPRDIRAVREGRARVQDEGSQLVTQALLAADIAVPDDTWLDMCAGPGGKTALLAAIAAQRGVGVLSAELHGHRAGLVAEAVSRAGLGGVADVVRADSTRPPWASGSFSRVLLDAPCTGLGALRRRPEARWRRSPADLERLVPLQRALLHAALDSAAIGGAVGYVTCSPHLAETVEIVEAVLRERADVGVEDAAALLDIGGAARGPYVQLWGDVHGTDAMFLAVLRRTGRAGTA